MSKNSTISDSEEAHLYLLLLVVGVMCVVLYCVVCWGESCMCLGESRHP